MNQPLRIQDQIRTMKLGDHSCLIYESFEEQMAAVVPFIKAGLENDEACVYIIDDRSLEDVHQALRDGGIDLECEIGRGALSFVSKREAYLRAEVFDPEAMIEYLKKLMVGALEDGFAGYRVTGEMTWALGSECGCNRLIEYESLLNEFFPDSKIVAICQYNKKRFSPEIIHDVLRTHPIAILGDQVCTNLYYEDPKKIRADISMEGKVDWMIQQLRRFRSGEQKLELAVHLRDEFLSIASHELRTPLASLKFQNDMYRRSFRQSADSLAQEDWSELLEVNHRQINQLVSLVDQMLDLSRVTHGQIMTNRCELDLKKLTQRLVDETCKNSSALTIRFDGDSEVLGYWDRMRVEQVVHHLLANAIKYGAGRPIEVQVAAKDDWAELIVSDQGIGISKSDQVRIFERFERAVPSRYISGLGIGLYLSKQIVEEHNGSISVESELGRGAKFTVRLPLARAFKTPGDRSKTPAKDSKTEFNITHEQVTSAQ